MESILKHSNRSKWRSVVVQVSAPYNNAGSTAAWYTASLVLCERLGLFHTWDFRVLKTLAAFEIRDVISLSNVASLDNILPRYWKWGDNLNLVVIDEKGGWRRW